MHHTPLSAARAWLITLVTLLAAGCATQPQVQLASEFWADKQQRVGVLVLEARPGAAGVQTSGNQGLLDIAISSAMMSTLNGHLQKQESAELKALAERVALRLGERGITAVMIDRKMGGAGLTERAGGQRDGYAKHDFATLGTEYRIDKLLVLSPEFTGSDRGYYAFIPTDDPRGNFRSIGQLIELPSHKLLWYKPIDSLRTVRKPWDQPPDFPNVTAAMRDAISAGVRVLEADLFWSAR